MNKVIERAPTVARYLVGLVYFVFGLNGFLHFAPTPPMPEAAGNLLGAFVGSGYLMYLVKGTEVAVGAFLLLGRFSPLALIVAAPITLNIVLFHAILAPAGMFIPLLMLAAHLLAAWGYRDVYRPLFNARAAVAKAPDSVRAVASAHA